MTDGDPDSLMKQTRRMQVKKAQEALAINDASHKVREQACEALYTGLLF